MLSFHMFINITLLFFLDETLLYYYYLINKVALLLLPSLAGLKILGLYLKYMSQCLRVLWRLSCMIMTVKSNNFTGEIMSSN